jgi:hypothetical protein
MPRNIQCPQCGWDGTTEGDWDTWFRYLEDVTHERRVHGFDEQGTLQVEADERIALFDPGANRLQCGNCLNEFPIPSGTQITFV